MNNQELPTKAQTLTLRAKLLNARTSNAKSPCSDLELSPIEPMPQTTMTTTTTTTGDQDDSKDEEEDADDKDDDNEYNSDC